jgi:hypothetical protein
MHDAVGSVGGTLSSPSKASLFSMRSLLLAVLVTLTACSTVERRFDDHADVFRRATGKWAAVEEGPADCSAVTEIISFSRDLSTATNHSPGSILTISGRPSDTVTYTVLSVRANVITMYLNGETRTTDGGDPVVWSLVLTGDDSFFWRRTDWPKGSATVPRVRCAD